ncbi:hypothetical protein PI23P_01957 [Polaribacter irgensii 23-P]|uniref:Uncharacterized protein n=1 Tax=Polaribacter irgensii 23-P TaxID=313594 RepID=A4BW78_9FLAO|nr:hypothetical protein PI23P_01957 [Polaribacter irgensii 23-P]
MHGLAASALQIRRSSMNGRVLLAPNLVDLSWIKCLKHQNYSRVYLL